MYRPLMAVLMVVVGHFCKYCVLKKYVLLSREILSRKILHCVGKKPRRRRWEQKPVIPWIFTLKNSMIIWYLKNYRAP